LLIPKSGGVGTHEELGLPPCGFYLMFHKPCPSCGMTTSFALLMHGKIIQAIKAQPAGVFSFCLPSSSILQFHITLQREKIG